MAEEAEVLEEAEEQELEAGEDKTEEILAEEADGETDKEPEKEADDKDERQVPLAALYEERYRRQELQRQVEEAQRKTERMEEMFTRFREEALGAKEQQHIPKYEDDPEGNLKGTIAALQKEVEAFKQQSTQQQEQSKGQAQQQQLLEQYASDVRAFSAEKKDFQEAYNHLAKAMDDDLKARGFEDPMERRNILQYEEGVMVGRALKSGKSPAEIIYNYAKARGYMNGKGEEDKLERLQKGADASKSLGNVKGKGDAPTTLERLAELADTDPDAFDREWYKAQQKGLLG